MKPYKIFFFEDLEGECWMPLGRYYNHYSVSNLGRVRVESRIIDGRRHKSKIKKGRLDQHGYVHTTLVKDGLRKIEKHHRLVAEAFIPNPQNKPFINHKNGVKDDNRAENLEWCTAKENSKHAKETGRIVVLYGEDSSMSKLTNNEAVEIFNSSCTPKELSKKYMVSESCIYGIKTGLYYSEITGKEYKKKELKTSSKIIEWSGLKMNLIEIANMLGGTSSAISDRFKKGWPLEKIMTTPIKKYNYTR